MFAATRAGVMVRKQAAVTGPTYRYWRLSVTGFAGQYMCMAELQLVAADGVTQLATQSSGATAVSVPAGPGATEALIDGNPATAWWVDGYPTSATLTLTTPAAISPKYLRIQARNVLADSQTPQNFTLQASSNAAEWVTVLAPPTQSSWTNGQVRTFTL